MLLCQVVGVCEEELKAAQHWNGPSVLNLIRTIPLYDQFCSLIEYYRCTVFRLDALALSVIATATWLAGWVAVALRYCIKTAKPIGKLF